MKLQFYVENQSVVISVDSFPFTLGRNLAEFQSTENICVILLESLRHISRRHATFSRVGQTIYLQDEQTLNGTTVNNVELGTDPVAISSGDRLCLATKLNLIVTIEDPAEKAEDFAGEADFTVYANDATVFMNVVTDIGIDAGAGKAIVADLPGKSDQASQTKGLPLLPSWKVSGPVLVVATILVLSWLMYQTGAQYKAKKYVKQQQYGHALEVVDAYLAENNTVSMHALGKKAFMHLALAELMISEGKHSTAELKERLAILGKGAQNIKGSGLIVETLLFIARTEQFFQKEGVEQGLGGENWKEEIHTINTMWLEKKHLFHPVIVELGQVRPKFINISSLFFSNLNESRELELYEIDQWDRLEKEVVAAVRQDDYEQVTRLIREYDHNHPSSSSGKVLQADVDAYIMLQQLAKKRNVEEAYLFIGKLSLQSKLIEGLAAQYIREKYPTVSILRLLSEALQAGENGLLQQALQVLKNIADNPWNDIVSERIKSYEAMKTLVAIVENDGESSEKCKAIAQLYTLAGEAPYYRNRYEKHYGVCRDQLKLQVDRYLAEAKTLFAQYDQDGGITGRMRMEGTISKRYRSQAQLLAAAYQQAGRAETMVRAYGGGLAQQHETQLSIIRKEYKRQHDRLRESTVLSSGVKQEKIDLLQQGKGPGNE